MIGHSHSWTAGAILSVGALTLAAVIFAPPAGASFRGCNSNCQLGDTWCFWQCRCYYKKSCSLPTVPKAAISRAPKPVTEEGAPTQPTRLHR